MQITKDSSAPLVAHLNQRKSFHALHLSETGKGRHARRALPERSPEGTVCPDNRLRKGINVIFCHLERSEGSLPETLITFGEQLKAAGLGLSGLAKKAWFLMTKG